MKCRVVYKLDKTVAVIHPAPKARRSGETESAFLKRVCQKVIKSQGEMIDGVLQKLVVEQEKTAPSQEVIGRLHDQLTEIGERLEGLPHDDIEPSELPSRKDRDKWRGKKGQGIYIDHSIITEAEKRQAIEDELDAELTKDNPDAIKAVRLQRKLDKRQYD
jgi:hypothetical protein